MKFKIEIAPEEYHVVCTYAEALLYCFSLNIDGKTSWRLPTREEWTEYNIWSWYLIDYIPPIDLHLQTVPVRDIT